MPISILIHPHFCPCPHLHPHPSHPHPCPCPCPHPHPVPIPILFPSSSPPPSSSIPIPVLMPNPIHSHPHPVPIHRHPLPFLFPSPPHPMWPLGTAPPEQHPAQLGRALRSRSSFPLSRPNSHRGFLARLLHYRKPFYLPQTAVWEEGEAEGPLLSAAFSSLTQKGFFPQGRTEPPLFGPRCCCGGAGTESWALAV